MTKEDSPAVAIVCAVLIPAAVSVEYLTVAPAMFEVRRMVAVPEALLMTITAGVPSWSTAMASTIGLFDVVLRSEPIRLWFAHWNR